VPDLPAEAEALPLEGLPEQYDVNYELARWELAPALKAQAPQGAGSRARRAGLALTGYSGSPACPEHWAFARAKCGLPQAAR
jgi:hypothetical protein